MVCQGPLFLRTMRMGLVRSRACVWQDASFSWSFMSVCVGSRLVPLVVHGAVCGSKPCSLGRSWVSVWEEVLFPWPFMDGHVCGKGPRSLGRSWMGMCVARGLVPLVVHGWACVWQGASFPWSFMGMLCGKVPRFLGRLWMGMCVARCLVPLVVHGHVCGKMPCSHRYPDCVACHDLALPASHAFFPWSFMDGHVCGKVPCSLGRSWACCVARGLASLAVHGQVCVKGPSFLGRSWMGNLASLVVHGWASVWQGA